MVEQEWQDIIKRMERLEAVHEIRNLMGRYETYHFSRKEIHRTAELFALWRPDCCIEEGAHGVALGTEQVCERWRNVKPGNLHAAAALHLASTPTIEVAGNGQTAKGTFLSMGMGSSILSLEQKKVREQWCIGKYAIDFIRNPSNGEWKIWHLHWYRLIINDYDKGFVSHLFEADKREELAHFPGRAETQFHRSLSLYEDTHPFPFPPEPYYDYDGDFRWQYGGNEMEREYGVVYKHYEKQYNINYPEKI